MAQMLSFAGITLPLETHQLREWLGNVHPQKIFEHWNGWNFDQPFTDSYPTPSLPNPPRVELGVLQWPTGATRPAWFFEVVNTAKLNQIRDIVVDPMVPEDLVMFDGRDASSFITASMYLLPALPLNQLGHDSSDAWLLVLADQRFYWHWRRGTITTQPASWNDLYNKLATILGISITIDPVDAAFATPSKKWVNYYGPTPVILDAVAEQVGQRIVVGLDGSVKTTNFLTALNASNSYIGNAGKVISGGFLDATDLGRYVPASVNTLFIDTSTSPPAAAPHVVNNTLVSLAIGGYGSSVGVTGFSQTLFADLPYNGTNITAVNNYAAANATAWYGWRAADTDIVYPGIEPWVPTGWEDAVEWTFQKRESQPFASTAIRRGPWNSFQSGNWFAGLTPAPKNKPTDCGGGCGWFTGMSTGWCLLFTVVAAEGSCSGIDTTQTFYMRWVTDHWISQVWDTGSKMWVDANFVYDGGSGPVTVTYDTTKDSIALAINGIDLSLNCCDDGFAVFSGGPLIDPTLCEGTTPSPCDPNTFRVKVECVCCPVDGWGGPGWYCVLATGMDCDTGTIACADYTTTVPCGTDIVICSGPYDNQTDCLAICTSPPPPSAPCQGYSTVSSIMGVWSMKTGDCTCLSGTTAWSAAAVDDYSTQATGCEGSPAFRLHCVGGNYVLDSTFVGIVCGLVSFVAGPPTVIVFDVSGFGVNCGIMGGTARFTITITP